MMDTIQLTINKKEIEKNETLLSLYVADLQ